MILVHNWSSHVRPCSVKPFSFFRQKRFFTFFSLVAEVIEFFFRSHNQAPLVFFEPATHFAIFLPSSSAHEFFLAIEKEVSFFFAKRRRHSFFLMHCCLRSVFLQISCRSEFFYLLHSICAILSCASVSILGSSK